MVEVWAAMRQRATWAHFFCRCAIVISSSSHKPLSPVQRSPNIIIRPPLTVQLDSWSSRPGEGLYRRQHRPDLVLRRVAGDEWVDALFGRQSSSEPRPRRCTPTNRPNTVGVACKLRPSLESIASIYAGPKTFNSQSPHSSLAFSFSPVAPHVRSSAMHVSCIRK